MNAKRTGSTPERVLLHLGSRDGELTGKAIRFRDETEVRFHSLRELVDWLRSLESDRDPRPNPTPRPTDR